MKFCGKESFLSYFFDHFCSISFRYFKMNSTKSDSYYSNLSISDTAQADFFIHMSIKDLVARCVENKEKITKFRTIGVLESVNGTFYIKDINLLDQVNSSRVQVSMAYVKASLPSAVIPYTLQIFGTIQWKGKPVIYANIIQVLNTATALRLNEAVTNITRNHLANRVENKDT